MDLRRFLFEKRWSQQQVLRSLRARGFELSASGLSLHLNKQAFLGPRGKVAVIEGLRGLGAPLKAIREIEDLRVSRAKMRAYRPKNETTSPLEQSCG